MAEHGQKLESTLKKEDWNQFTLEHALKNFYDCQNQ